MFYFNIFDGTLFKNKRRTKKVCQKEEISLSIWD